MSIVDFLFGGKAPTAGSSTTTTSIQLPAWYNEYAADILGKSKAIGDLPYATYTGPRIADFTTTEREGFEKAKTAAGAYKPSLKEAYDALGASKKYSGLGAAEDALSRAEKMSGAGAARDYFSKAAGASGVAAAQPYLAYAARTFPEAAAEYMNPYTKAVVEQLADVGVKQLQEKYLPAVGEEFIRSGQFGVGPGSTRMGEFGARALRDVQQSVLSEQSKALQAGYGQAADIFARDVERIAGIGGRVGQLTGEDASRLADIGRAAGQLTSADAELLSRIGSTRGELSLKDAENLRALADKYMGAAEVEQTLGGREAKTYMDIGEKEREMKQKNLELAYKDFLEQEKDPERKLAFMAEILKSIQLPETQVVEKSETPGSAGEKSLIEKIITGAGGAKEILDLIEKYFPKKSDSTNPANTGNSETRSKPQSTDTSNSSSSSSLIKNPYYQKRSGNVTTTDVKFSDKEYVSPSDLNLFETEQKKSSENYQKAVSDPNKIIKEIGGVKFWYSPSTGSYLEYTG